MATSKWYLLESMMLQPGFTDADLADSASAEILLVLNHPMAINMHQLCKQLWFNLVKVSFTGTGLESADVLLLVSCLLDHIEEINLSRTKLDAVAMQAFKDMDFPTLTSLDLSHNDLGWAGVASLVNSNIKNLEYLNVEDSHLDDQAIQLLASGTWPDLQCLNIASNDFSFAAYSVYSVRQLVKAWEWLTYLHLPQKSLTPWMQSYLSIASSSTEVANGLREKGHFQLHRKDMPQTTVWVLLTHIWIS